MQTHAIPCPSRVYAGMTASRNRYLSPISLSLCKAALFNLLVTFTELAAVRGVSQAAVSTAVKTGRIAAAVVEKDGRRLLDRELALELWEKNTRHKHHGPHKQIGRAPRPKPAPDAPSPAPQSPPPAQKQTPEQLKRSVALLPDDQVPDLQTSRERREHYQAELAKLQVDEKRGELVAVEAVKKEAFTLGRVVRDALLNIPDRVSHQLAGEIDPAAIHQMLSKEMQQALEGLANG